MEQTINSLALRNGVEESVFQIMWENAPYISSILVIASLAAWLSFRLARIFVRFEKNERILFETVTRLDRVELRLDRVESRLDRIETKLDMLIEFLFKGKPDEGNKT